MYLSETSQERLLEAKPLFDMIDSFMGFIPNNYRIMARNPELLKNYLGFAHSIMGPSSISQSLKMMVGYITSINGGCRYCQAHTAHQAENNGVAIEKLDCLWNYENSDLFTPEEKTALHFARAASAVPNAIEAHHYVDIRKHYSDDQVMEITAVVSFYTFMNTWSQTFSVTLEEQPNTFAKENLKASGWIPERHNPE